MACHTLPVHFFNEGSQTRKQGRVICDVLSACVENGIDFLEPFVCLLPFGESGDFTGRCGCDTRGL